MLRRLGLAARFVSGYLIQLDARREAARRPGRADADFTDLHAWAEVYMPGRRLDRPRPDLRPVAPAKGIPLAATPEPDQRRADHRRAVDEGRGRRSTSR